MKYPIIAIILLLSLDIQAQETTQAQDSIPREMRRQAFLYNMGKKYNDPTIVRMALYNLMVDYPGTTSFMDTLALHYLDYQQYASAALVAQDVIAINPEDMFATEIAAIAFEQLGINNRAVNYYEKLYTKELDVSVLYKVAFLQMELKRYEEAVTNADIISGSSQADEIVILFPVNDNQDQQVSLKVAAIRLRGMIESSRGNKEEAKNYYNKALELKPDFAVVKAQLEQLSK